MSDSKPLTDAELDGKVADPRWEDVPGLVAEVRRQRALLKKFNDGWSQYAGSAYHHHGCAGDRGCSCGRSQLDLAMSEHEMSIDEADGE